MYDAKISNHAKLRWCERSSLFPDEISGSDRYLSSEMLSNCPYVRMKCGKGFVYRNLLYLPHKGNAVTTVKVFDRDFPDDFQDCRRCSANNLCERKFCGRCGKRLSVFNTKKLK